MIDFAANRTMMVDTQVRPSDVTKFQIIDALLTVRREAFVPASRREVAYADANIALGDGRVVFEPRTLAKMLDAMEIDQGDMVLCVAAGLGYTAAVLSRMAEAVVAVEQDPDLARDAESVLAEQGADNVVVIEGDLAAGAAKHGPYDAIIIEGGVEDVPAALGDQLKDGGRIGTVFMRGELGECRIGLKAGAHINWRLAFNASAPVLPGFEAETAFSL